MILILIVCFVIALLLITNIRVVPQANEFVVERLGTYLDSWGAGLHVKVPFLDRIALKISLKEQIVDFPPQPVITKDNVTINVDTVVYYQVTDTKLYAYGVENPISAIENLTATTLRNIIGEMELDECLVARDEINSKMRVVLDKATDAWGQKVNRVEVKNITPPRDIQEAMEKQMRAEREKRESILKAEGEKQSSILKAEGKKAAQILEAEADKESAIKRAEGKAKAIELEQQATAYGIDILNKAAPSREILTLRSIDAMKDVANGQATTIIIPSEMQEIAGLTK